MGSAAQVGPEERWTVEDNLADLRVDSAAAVVGRMTHSRPAERLAERHGKIACYRQASRNVPLTAPAVRSSAVVLRAHD